jgi:crotonobetainyl-CoA:carnitine CoA-transferase CaiB-like acyl-CoA transferase
MPGLGEEDKVKTMDGRPLSGVRVLDFSRVLAGPLCGRLLADQGAEVIKIEPPRRDITRTAPPLVAGFSPYFTQVNAGKLGISVDLSDPEVAGLMARLADGADVFLENFRPGVLARYGLDAPTLLRSNPRLIYCSISGYGQHGVWRDRRCYAPVVHGEAGIIASNARLHDSPARPEAMSHADIQSGLMAMGAISSALFDRERSGRGGHLDISLAEVSFYTNEFSAPELCGQTGPATYAGAASLILTLGDGTKVTTQGNPADSFRDWLAAMKRPELRDDPRFHRYGDRLRHRRELDEIILEFARSFESFDAFYRCVDPHRIAVGVVRSVSELAQTQWAKERGLVVEPSPGMRFPRVPYRTSRGEIGAVGRAPRRGEHNREALQRLLGLDDALLAALEERGALCAADDGIG